MPSPTLARRLRAACLHALFLLPLWTAGWQPAQAQTAALPPEVEAALARARLPREALSVWVADAQAGPRAAPRLAWRAQVPANPASVMKLVTTYAGLDLLGPAYVWNTPVYVDGPVSGGVLQGNVYIQGRGDPKLVLERLWLLLRRLQAQGIRTIAGDIVLDRSAFSLPPHDPAGFDGEPFKPYNAAPDALLVNYRSLVLDFIPDRAAGVARVSVEPPLAGLAAPAAVPLSAEACGDWRGQLQASLADPARIGFAGSYPAACGERAWPIAPPAPDTFAARAIEGLWRQTGGELRGRVRDGRVPAGLQPVFTAASPPLAEVIRDINKFSNNVMAQQLFLTLSLQARGTGSFDASREVLAQWWRSRIAADLPVPLIDNGAGLSRDAQVAPAALGRMLQVAWATPAMPELIASLPIAGVDGTLKRSQARWSGAAHLKTGSLRDAAAIAGYVHAASGRRYVVVAIVNHPNANGLRPVFDALVDWVGSDTAN
ncbi:D-alanyl-D-alanine carboxypeptidase/D-alanyl-D-alanine endopeptidase [Xylophilus sp.]|uniref:D-alanyl-D-alanine carboxypeptidase/D-alanyl-D-alanine endopeptidase n=1 Tax=Xylophilus sp. TaxID=2653893 RepID=UPI0013BB78A1|nr:D-alanyl-D-alanine carboxypeptidase/D-alanyl-D-alanine-endopeptidase [Xylophilus sp.]KAF1050110.1 MAG: D-alanyl-D-alanine carboxypeptidase DacB [Xylophilus sp.]